METKSFVCKKDCQEDGREHSGDICVLTVVDIDFVPTPDVCPYDRDAKPEWKEKK